MFASHSLIEVVSLDDATGIFGVLFIVFGGFCALLLVNQKTLRDSRDDQGKRIEILEKEQGRLKQTIADREATIAGKDGELDALRKVVTGEVHLVAISDLLTQHHSEAVTQWQGMDVTLAHIDTTLVGFPEAITAAIATAFAAGRKEGEKS